MDSHALSRGIEAAFIVGITGIAQHNRARSGFPKYHRAAGYMGSPVLPGFLLRCDICDGSYACACLVGRQRERTSEARISLLFVLASKL